MVSRRKFIAAGTAALAGLAVEGSAEARVTDQPASTNGEYTPVIVPNGATLPFKRAAGVKIFHLIAEPVQHEMSPGLNLECWGYNGRTPGPVIEVVEGDRVRIYVTNKLPEPTTVHWHGVLLPNGMDGVSGLTQPPIQVGETFRYEFTFKHPGTFMYHPHFDEMTQMGLGMMGMIVVHPKRRIGPKVDRDFSLMLSEWFVEPGARRPNPSVMNEFNLLTFNSRAFPGTEPLVVRTGERVRIRFGNLGAMDHHPIHLHGFTFRVTGTDGGPVPLSAQKPETAVLVPVGTTRDIELVADVPGDWPMHCHMTHHIMNQMGHDLPNLIGADLSKLDAAMKPIFPDYTSMGAEGMGGHAEHMEHLRVPKNSIPMRGMRGPFGYIDMGGMFTILKVRNELSSRADPGWYEHPKGEVASVATAEELERDGIDSGEKKETPDPHRHHKHHAPTRKT
jgi:FtsP/CotA-like multicopper oxidase with cupredoxin domain